MSRLDILELQKYWDHYEPDFDSKDSRKKYWINEIQNNILYKDEKNLTFILSLF